MSGDVLLVGETNPFGGDPAFALYHEPRYSSGNQLRLILGLTDDEYEALGKINLCTGRWSTPQARRTWAHVVLGARLVVLLGRKVQLATKGPEPFEHVTLGPSVLLGLPHPSGLNRIWHQAGARNRARAAFEALLSRSPHGTTPPAGGPK